MNNKVFITILGISFVVGCFAQHLPVLDSCITCDSSRNITCATDPDSHHRFPCNTLPILQGCYTRIVGAFTIRGCSSDLDEAVLAECHSDRCITCAGDTVTPVFGCNNLIFPVNRHQCHQCQGDVNGTCDAIPDGLPTVCEMFDVNDRCYIHRTNFTVTRGCTSDHRRLCGNPEHCHFCEISGCNNVIGNSPLVPIAPGSAATNKISMFMLSTAFIFALAKFF